MNTILIIEDLPKQRKKLYFKIEWKIQKFNLNWDDDEFFMRFRLNKATIIVLSSKM